MCVNIFLCLVCACMYLGMALRSKGGAALEADIRKARGGIAVSEGVYIHT